MSEIEHFRRIAGDNPFKAWLEKEKAAQLKYLINAVDPIMVHRAQGQLQLIERIETLLEKAKDLR